MKRQIQNVASGLVGHAKKLRDAVECLKFKKPVTHVYNPLAYAWTPHRIYLEKYGSGTRRIVFLGMNPGPFGMVQTGVPFGEINAVRNWLKIEAPVSKPATEHPQRLVTGFDCPRSEVSGQRLWGLFADRFKTADFFFADHIVLNYCPLAFLESTGRNRTPDKLTPTEKEALFKVCDEHLREALALLKPEWVVGIGDFAWKRATSVANGATFRLARILHPSPASPAANRDWPRTATQQLTSLGIWR